MTDEAQERQRTVTNGLQHEPLCLFERSALDRRFPGKVFFTVP
jgi:hypothetical protein